MLFHASLPARDPQRVASVLAELWRGAAYPFPPFPGSFVAIADDDRGTALEIYPAGQVLVPGPDEVGHRRVDDGRPSETHVAIAVRCDEATVHAIARREGWLCRTCSRGGFFHVIEVWLENRVMVEALTDEMQREYLAFATRENWDNLVRTLPREAVHTSAAETV
jgi:hypothetical protein